MLDRKGGVLGPEVSGPERHTRSLGVLFRFSKVTYEFIAPFVGLDQDKRMNDTGTFEPPRFRIRTTLFKSVLTFCSHSTRLYPPHSREEQTSRFLSPVSTKLNNLHAAVRALFIDWSLRLASPSAMTEK